MLEEVMESREGLIDLFSRAAAGELQIDLQRGVILNSAGLPNPYYIENVKRWVRVQTEHPVLTGAYGVAYCATHPLTAIRILIYLQKLR